MHQIRYSLFEINESSTYEKYRKFHEMEDLEILENDAIAKFIEELITVDSSFYKRDPSQIDHAFEKKIREHFLKKYPMQ